jgi:hypothetical protein
MIFSSLLTILPGFTNLEAIALMIAVILLLLAPVLAGFRAWLERLD